MTTFEDRERAFEAKWAHDEEMQFRLIVRRNELLGRWAGAELGLQGAAMEDYVAGLVALALTGKNLEALTLKLRADLGPAHSDAVILRKMEEFHDAAAMDAGLGQRPAPGKDAGPAKDGNVTHVDFTQVFRGADVEPLDRDGMHFRMLRKVSRRSPD